MKSLVLIAVVASILLLRELEPLLVPLTIALILSLVLAPAVDALQRRRLPRGLAAVLVTFGLSAVVLAAPLQLAGPLERWVTQVPEAVSTLEQQVSAVQHRLGSLSHARRQLAQLADRVTGRSGDQTAVQLAGDATTEAALYAGELATSFLITALVLLFLLATGNRMTRRLVLLPTSRRRRRQWIRAIRAAQHGASRYLTTITAINLLLALTATLMLWILGVPDPWLWGLLGGLLNYLPYVGTIVTVLAISVAALLSQSGAAAMLAPGALYLALNGIEATVITPAVLGERLAVNPLFIVLAIVSLGWLWGVGGMFIAVPALVICKIVLSQLDQPGPRIARVLGR